MKKRKALIRVLFCLGCGGLTGILWAYLCPIPLIPGSVHFRTFAFIPPLLSYLFGPVTGFFSGYIGTVIWALLSGSFIPLHTPLVDGITVGLSAALPAFIHLKRNRFSPAELIAQDRKVFILKSLGLCLLFSTLMVLTTSISLSYFTGLSYSYCAIWIGIADVVPVAVTPFLTVLLEKRVSNTGILAPSGKENHQLFINTGVIIWLAVMCALFLFINTGTLKSSPVVEVRADNNYTETLRVVTDEDYRPYSFYGERGEYSGHDVELIALLANKLNMNLDLWLVPWQDGIDAVTSGRADILMTCDWSDNFSGSDQLIRTEPVSSDDFIVYSRSHLSSPDELYTMKIAITENANVLPQLQMLNLTGNCIAYSSNRRALQAVSDGEADCAVMRNTVGTTLLQGSGLDDIKGRISIGKSYMCFGISRDNQALADRINCAIEELKKEGVLIRLSDKWLTTFVTPYTLSEVLSNNPWIVIAFALLAVILCAIFLREQDRRRRSIQEKSFYIDVVGNLTNDFDSVIYIGHYDENPDAVVELKLSDVFRRNIQGWEKEPDMDKRMALMAQSIVVPEDQAFFTEATRRRTIIRRLDSKKVCFVNFGAVTDGERHEYQIKFSAGCSTSGELKSCIIGIHRIDKELTENTDII